MRLEDDSSLTRRRDEETNRELGICVIEAAEGNIPLGIFMNSQSVEVCAFGSSISII